MKSLNADDLIIILQALPPDAREVSFLCPDGYEDCFTGYERNDDGVMFLGYKHAPESEAPSNPPLAG